MKVGLSDTDKTHIRHTSLHFQTHKPDEESYQIKLSYRWPYQTVHAIQRLFIPMTDKISASCS